MIFSSTHIPFLYSGCTRPLRDVVSGIQDNNLVDRQNYNRADLSRASGPLFQRTSNTGFPPNGRVHVASYSDRPYCTNGCASAYGVGNDLRPLNDYIRIHDRIVIVYLMVADGFANG